MKFSKLLVPNFRNTSEPQYTLLAPISVDSVRELDAIKFVASIIKENGNQGTFIDVGSHIGFYAIPLSNLFKNVIAFEPSRMQRELLQKNILLNKISNIEVQSCALGESRERLDLKVMGKSGGSNTLGNHAAEFPPMEVYEVEVLALDAFNLTNVDFIKIDVEGWELQVLKGATKTLLTSKPQVLVEVWDDDLQRNLVAAFFKKMSYTFDFIFPKFPELAYCKPKGI